MTTPTKTRHPWRRILLRILALVPLTGAVLWSAAALWIDGPAARWLAGPLVAAFLGGVGALFWFVKPFWRGFLCVLGSFLLVLGWWFLIPPRNDRNWQSDVAQLPTATFNNQLVTIRNLRNFEYRSETDYTEHWETRTYDLDRIAGFDLFISYWGPTLYAHTVASWEFTDGQHLAISIETRKEKGETYSALRGFFRQYELYYVVADERDLIGVRAGPRAEHVYLYRFKMPPATARALLVEYLDEINQLAEHPKWYNALTHNCTTAIRYHFKQVAPLNRWNWRVLANGYLDELMYERGNLDTSLPFAELRQRSEITEQAKAALSDPAFSQRIREGLPGSHSP